MGAILREAAFVSKLYKVDTAGNLERCRWESSAFSTTDLFGVRVAASQSAWSWIRDSTVSSRKSFGFRRSGRFRSGASRTERIPQGRISKPFGFRSGASWGGTIPQDCTSDGGFCSDLRGLLIRIRCINTMYGPRNRQHYCRRNPSGEKEQEQEQEQEQRNTNENEVPRNVRKAGAGNGIQRSGRRSDGEKEVPRNERKQLLSFKFLVGWHTRRKSIYGITSRGGGLSFSKSTSYNNSAWLRKSVERWNSDAILPPLRVLPAVAHVFTVKEMRRATEDFSQDNLIGEGGFGQVFRGVLADGRVVAVKQMDPTSSVRHGVQGEREFRVEVDILSRLSHPHLVRLIGYCADYTHRLLVYEYMSNGNLQELLHGILRVRLDWQTRLRIALGAAKALAYLHSGRATGNPVIHRDFKSSNVLLDDDLRAKVSDFGLAKLVPYGNKPYVSTRVIGTVGYFDPKYTSTGRLTVKSDVYGFGVVLLELLTGRRAVDASFECGGTNLVFRVRETLKSKKKLKKVIDGELNPDTYSFASVKKFADLAARCIRDEDSRRPMMYECVKELHELYLQSKEFR